MSTVGAFRKLLRQEGLIRGDGPVSGGIEPGTGNIYISDRETVFTLEERDGKLCVLRTRGEYGEVIFISQEKLETAGLAEKGE